MVEKKTASAKKGTKALPETVGALLRQAREDKRQDVEFVSQALRIHEDHLLAIERDDMSALPAPAYAIGFIRSYADYLGLNPDVLIARHKEQQRVTQPELDFPIMDLPHKMPGMNVLLSLIGGLIVVILFWAVFVTTEDMPSEKAGVFSTTSTPADVADDDAMSFADGDGADNSAEPTGANLPEADRTAAGRSDSIGQASTTEQTNTGSSDTDSSDTGSPATGTADIGIAETDTLDTVALNAPGIEAVALAIRARVETWMRVENEEGRILFSSIILPGERFTFPAGEKFFLATRNAGALDYVMADEVLGEVGLSGQVLNGRRVEPGVIIERYLRRRQPDVFDRNRSEAGR